MRRTLGILGPAAGLALSSATVLAQAYGTGSQVTIIPAMKFQPSSSVPSWGSTFGTQLTPGVGPVEFDAPIELPNGAVIEEVDFFVEDSDPANDIVAKLAEYGQGVDAGDCLLGAFWFASTSGTPGIVALKMTGSPITIQARRSCGSYDGYFQYYLEVLLHTPGQHTLSGAAVHWHRQIRAAPVTATFSDVPTDDPFFRAIEALAAAGITSGCGGGNFCPNDVVTRNQLAKFLANALGLHFPE